MWEAKDGLHIAENHILVETVDIHTGEVLEPGQVGELVFTTLRKHARPLICFRTGDIGRIDTTKCSCGRTHGRIHILGRKDDMFIVSAVNVFPSDIEAVVREQSGITGEYLIRIFEKDFTNKYAVEIEKSADNTKSDDEVAERSRQHSRPVSVSSLQGSLYIRTEDWIHALSINQKELLTKEILTITSDQCTIIMCSKKAVLNPYAPLIVVLRRIIMPTLSKRTEGFTDSVIRRMTRISNQYGAVNLSQGFPDFEPPRGLLDRLAEVTKEDFHQYSITWGAQNFREALAEKQSRLMGRKIDPNGEIVVTCGSTEAMMAAMMTVTNPGDKVIVFSPFYENYGADTILSGAEPIYVPLYPPEFNFSIDELEAAFKQKPKALILCNPSNPCGKVFSYEELKIIADLAEKYDTFVITDEVYEHIVYAPYKHTYFASLPGMWERTISCSSLSKTYSITGWRLGYIIAPPEIIDTAKKVHDFLTVGAAAPLQEAAVTGLRFGEDYYKDLQKKYTEKRDLFLKGLDDIGIIHTVPQGAYYILLDISEFGYKSDLEFCEALARDVGVGAVPGSSFFREDVNHLIRLHFAKKNETLYEALNRLEDIRKKISYRKP